MVFLRSLFCLLLLMILAFSANGTVWVSLPSDASNLTPISVINGSSQTLK